MRPQAEDSYATALYCTCLLATLELVHFSGSYAQAFIGDARTGLSLSVHAMAVALVAAPVLAIAVGLARRLRGRLARLAAMQRPTLGTALQAALLGVFALAIVHGGKATAPLWQSLWQSALALASGAAWFLVARRPRLAGPDAARANFLVLASLWLNLDLVFRYSSYFARHRFGLQGNRPILTTVAAFVTMLMTLVVFELMARRPRQLTGAHKALWWVVAAALLAGLYHVNAVAYVDTYLYKHTRMLLFSLLLAWHLAELTPRARLVALLTRRPGRATAVALSLLAVSFLAQLERTSVTRYLAAIHTTHQRAAMELWARTGDWFGPRSPLAEVRRQLVDWHLMERRPEPARTLPSSFAHITRSPVAERPPLAGALLFLLDAKRPRDIGVYGQSVLTPQLDECFRDAFVFERSYAASNKTSLTFPTIYTSTYAASRHQSHPSISDRAAWFRTADGHNLGETFRRAGFQTRVITGAYYHEHFFQDPEQAPIYSGFDRIIPAVVRPGPDDDPELMLEAYRNSGGLIPEAGPFLVVVHIQAHHARWTPALDRLVGVICQELRESGRYDQTLLLATSDHGIQFGEHGRTRYSQTLYQGEIRVPLLVRLPGRTGRRIHTNVSSIDHLPMLVDAFRLPADYPVEGQSYLPELLGADAGARLHERAIFSEARTDVYSTGVIVGPHKLIRWTRTGATALFDVAQDPSEHHSLTDDPAQAERLHALDRLLDGFLEDHREPR